MGSIIDRWIACLGLASLLWAQGSKPQGFSFDPSTGVSNRLITPNGDGKNDEAVFTFANPRDSAIKGQIYDARGKFIADMEAVPNSSTKLRWNGKAGGAEAPAGIYLYFIEGEDTVFSGTVVVVK